MNKHHKLGLFILRIGLASLFLLWGIDKIVAPESTVKIFSFFYKIPISVDLSYALGALEIIFSIVFAAGLWKRSIYGLGVILHGVSTLSTYKQLLDPFGQNHLFIAAIPLLAGYIALYLLRDQDTLWTLQKKGK